MLAVSITYPSVKWLTAFRNIFIVDRTANLAHNAKFSFFFVPYLSSNLFEIYGDMHFVFLGLLILFEAQAFSTPKDDAEHNRFLWDVIPIGWDNEIGDQIVVSRSRELLRLIGECAGVISSNATREELDKLEVGPTIHLTFFQMTLLKPLSIRYFFRLVSDLLPEKGQEKNYFSLSQEIGISLDSTLKVMGLGHLLGIWRVRSPDTEWPAINLSLRQDAAKNGKITITRFFD